MATQDTVNVAVASNILRPVVPTHGALIIRKLIRGSHTSKRSNVHYADLTATPFLAVDVDVLFILYSKSKICLPVMGTCHDLKEG